MEVVIWQLTVILSVGVLFIVKGRRAAWWVAVVWTVWTVVALAFLPLVLIQLLSAWGTYGLCSLVANSWRTAAAERALRLKSEEELRQIKAVLAESQISDAERAAIEAIAMQARHKIRIVEGPVHYDVLLRAVAEAREVVCILSGWIGSPLLDNEVQAAFRAALARGVNVYIGYGWESGNTGHTMTDAALRARKFLDSLGVESAPGRLHVAEFPTHEKILVAEDYFVIGSNNWLSNRQFRNAERSVLISSSGLANKEAKRVIELVQSHSR